MTSPMRKKMFTAEAAGRAFPQSRMPANMVRAWCGLLLLSVFSMNWLGIAVPAFAQDEDAPARTEAPKAAEAAAVATDPFALLEMRLDAVRVLADFRTQESAGALMKLIDPAQSKKVREAAFNSLIRLTGRHDLKTDEAAWRTWWEEAAQWPAEQWRDQLMANFEKRNAELEQLHQQTVQRLTLAERRLYASLDAGQRDTALVNMLGDALPAIRLLCMELIVQRMASEDWQPNEALVTLIRASLDDGVKDMRRRAALLIRDLNDDAGADRVARLLVIRRDSDPDVISAYLKVMARLPRPDGVRAAFDLIERPDYSDEAAGVLAAAADVEGLLDRLQRKKALDICREQATGDQPPPTQVIALMARLGENEDWQRIERWLDHNSEAVREAAARAWAQSNRSLLPLAQRASDQVIRPIILLSAANRGNDLNTLLALVDHPPASQEDPKTWSDALVAMAGRVEPKGMIDVDKAMAEAGHAVALRERMISAAIQAMENAPDAKPGLMTELLLLRADLRLDQGDGPSALADYDKLTELNAALTRQQTIMLRRGRLRAHLIAAYVPGVNTAASGLISADQTQAEWVLRTIAESVDKHINARRFAEGKAVLTALRVLAGDSPSEPWRARIATLQQRLVEAEQTTAVSP